MPVCWLGSLRSACTSLRFSSRNLSVVSFHGGSPQVASAFGSTKSPEGRGSLQVASTHRSAGSPGGSGPEKEYRRRGASSMSSSELSNRMVWVDLEMTGLDIEKDQIIEMACVITDAELNVVAEGPNLVIKQPDQLLDGMSDWCKEHHGQSGLVQAVRESRMTLDQAEYEFLSFVRQHTPPGQCPLAGNSVHADKKFLDKYMPQFMFHLHYRIIDVSTIKELSRRWFPQEYKMVPQKKASHRALDDIQESIKELQYYRAVVFKEAMLHRVGAAENTRGKRDWQT